MGFSVYFTNSNKSENSTHAFSTTGQTYYDCTLKAGTSISNPVIELQISYAEFVTLSKANVAYIGSWERYYFVTDWRYDGRLCICSLSVDVLASFWDQLKLKQFYVTRSASLGKPEIVDTAYPVTARGRIQYNSSANNPFVPAPTDYGCYVVGVLSKSSGLDGCITYYVMGYLQFMVLMGKLYNSTTYGSLGTTGTNNDTFTADLVEAIVNPLQYIASIMWYPFSVATLNGYGWLTSTQIVEVGYTSINMGVTVYYYDNATLYKSITNLITLNITHHPDSATAYFMNLSPYAEYRLAFYPFGVFNIDPEYLQAQNYLYCLYTIDMRTGRGILNVGTSISGSSASDWMMSGAFLTSEAQVGVPIPTSTIQTQIGDMATLREAGFLTGKNLFAGLESTIRQGFTDISRAGSNPINALSALSDTATNVIGTLTGELQKISVSDVESALLQASASPNLSGTQGSISLFPKQKVSLNMWFKYRTGTDPVHKGYPLCEVKQLGTLTGFTVCSGAVADIYGATFAEKRKIESFLNTGFYIQPPTP